MPEFKGSALARTRSAVAVAHRKRDKQAIETARQNFAEAKIAAYIRKTLAETPELRPEQRASLQTLLDPS